MSTRQATAGPAPRASNAQVIRRLLGYMKPFNGIMFISLTTRIIKIVSQAAVLGIAAAREQGANAIADFALFHIGTNLDDDTGHFQPEDFASARRRRVATGGLHQVGPVVAVVLISTSTSSGP